MKPIGLGARDSLRLEAGLPLNGHDLSPEITPVDAALAFAINKRRRAEGGFMGADKVLSELGSLYQRRVGFAVEGKQSVREGALLFDKDYDQIGHITSGGFSPTLGRPIAMGYVAGIYVEPGTILEAEVRGKRVPLTVVPMPFVPHRYHR